MNEKSVSVELTEQEAQAVLAALMAANWPGAYLKQALEIQRKFEAVCPKQAAPTSNKG